MNAEELDKLLKSGPVVVISQQDGNLVCHHNMRQMINAASMALEWATLAVREHNIELGNAKEAQP